MQSARPAVTLAQFVEDALFGPTGYYHSGQVKFGKGFDFETLAEKWAPLLANRFFLVWQSMVEHGEIKSSDTFHIYEFGAGNGRMASVILQYLHGRSILEPNSPWSEFYNSVHYVIGEISPALAVLQKKELRAYLLRNKANVYITDARVIDNVIPRGAGVVVSNELIDTFPPQEITVTDDGVKATMVRVSGEKAEPFLMPSKEVLSSSDQAFLAKVLAFSDKFILSKPNQFIMHFAMHNYYQKLAAVLTRGYVFTLDYGHDGALNVLKDDHTPNLRVYSSEFGNDASIYDHAGKVDITSNINFSALELAGRECGFTACYFGMQDSLGGCAVDEFRVLIQRINIDPACDQVVCAGMKVSSPVRYEEMDSVFSTMVDSIKLISAAEAVYSHLTEWDPREITDLFSYLEQTLIKLLDYLHGIDYANRDRAYFSMVNDSYCNLLLKIVATALQHDMFAKLLTNILKHEKYAKILLADITGHMDVMIYEPIPEVRIPPKEIMILRKYLLTLLLEHQHDLTVNVLSKTDYRDYHLTRILTAADKTTSLLTKCLQLAEKANSLLHISVTKTSVALFHNVPAVEMLTENKRDGSLPKQHQ